MSQSFTDKRLAARKGMERELDALRERREVATLLRRMRSAAGLTQSELAERAGWKQSFVSRLERFSGAMPDPGSVARFAEACGFELEIVHRVSRPTPDGRVEVMEAVY